MYAQRAWISPALLSSLIPRMFPTKMEKFSSRLKKRLYISYQVLGALGTAQGIVVGGV